ncbi:biotin--[acetyl-CoA-carboxylase] ligase [Amantichitinum ursilacus]|uniref:biotin--[biotin carboxyl-carrier protein] ligase n=1 Tax=Amantichitinum ursilacus TaxID=857265 RepID=A0A0N0GMF5_9NEIS|nr:biotin--[acetyl-CoA-carboxylase] ligase [Amantichitinum ursilacus]KPC50847.1 Bifunctional ligase/repressor BirA [Amantichitinum ursilacus]
MNHTLACLRHLSADQFVSGAVIADALDLSRASVSTALAAAEEFGVTLERKHGVGYRLITPIDWLDNQTIRQHLPRHSVLDTEVLERTDSTNKQLLAQPRHGRVLAAEWQEGGRGRMGRRWQGRLGGSLMFSLGWAFAGGAPTLAGLPLAVGCIVTETLAECGVSQMALKWPNDLLLGNAKAGGILIELTGDALGPAYAVIGIGLNILAPAVDVAQVAAGLRDHGLSLTRNDVLARLLERLEQGLEEFSRNGFDSFRTRWEARHVWQGLPVNLLSPDGSVLAGVARGVTPSGALRLETVDGERIIHAGDVSLRLQTPAQPTQAV